MGSKIMLKILEAFYRVHGVRDYMQHEALRLKAFIRLWNGTYVHFDDSPARTPPTTCYACIGQLIVYLRLVRVFDNRLMVVDIRLDVWRFGYGHLNTRY